LGNNSSKMETRKDGRQEHKQIKKEWQKYEWNIVKNKDDGVPVQMWPPGDEGIRESGGVVPRIIMLVTVGMWVVSFESTNIYAFQSFLPYPLGQKQLENVEFLNYLGSICKL
jgi:hypothetical protein